MCAGDGQQLAAPLVQLDVQPEERLEPTAEAAAGTTHPLGDRAQAPAMGCVQVQDAIGLAVADRAQHDRFGLQGPRHSPFHCTAARGGISVQRAHSAGRTGVERRPGAHLRAGPRNS